jgi:hypothetical protein
MENNINTRITENLFYISYKTVKGDLTLYGNYTDEVGLVYTSEDIPLDALEPFKVDCDQSDGATYCRLQVPPGENLFEQDFTMLNQYLFEKDTRDFLFQMT